ncbi:MAG: iron-regulated protein, partial [Pseudobacteriovorax sp.]|nr:iron-regulated protein [Pseudobacteriovorax sp.]
ATATNGDRRAQYLKIASELIVDDLTGLIAEWDQDTATNYRNSFFLDQDTDAALRAMFSSIGILAKGELGAERIDNALDTQEQEDEHSCFSDNTYVDIKMNALGIQNVYLGRYGVDLDGPGLNDLVAAANPTLNSEIESLMTEILEEIDALPLTFDQVIIPGDAGADGRAKLEAIVISLQQLGNKMAEAASAIGLGTISVELPE